MNFASLVRSAVLAISALSLSGLGGACAEPDLGNRPAKCSDGRCPDGYDCVNAVCVEPGEVPPLLVQRVPNFRGFDLEVLPQSDGVLVVWQTYAYSDEGQGFHAARIRADGQVSERMTLVSSFVADSGSLEPFYDVIGVSDSELLVAVAAAPVDDSPEPRLIVYRVELPPPGQESGGTQFQAAWPAEQRMPTIGYGAVSQPRFASTPNGIQLGYVLSRTAQDSGENKTVAELAIFDLDDSGARVDVGCDGFGACCPADRCIRARADLPVAIGVADTLVSGDAVWWVLDHDRPSLVRSHPTLPAVELTLSPLNLPVSMVDGALETIVPSTRTGQMLDSDDVAGPASLTLLTVDTDGGAGGLGGAGGFGGAGGLGGAGGNGPEPGGELLLSSPIEASSGRVIALQTVRDTPRPRWLRDGPDAALIVSLGTSVTDPAIDVYRTKGENAEKLFSVPRFGTAEVKGLEAALVGTDLFVIWVDDVAGDATIRAAVRSIR